MFTSLIQIFKVQETKAGEKDGRKWEFQEAECALLNPDTGSVEEVGVLRIPKDLIGKVQPGTYSGTFTLRADKSREGGRRIGAVLAGLEARPNSVKPAPTR